MVLRIKFVTDWSSREYTVGWNRPIEEFPPVVVYDHRNWEFEIWTQSTQPGYDLDCVFSEIKIYDPRVTLSGFPTLEELMMGSYVSPTYLCDHERVTYTGLREVYDYCKKCNEKLT